MNHTTHPKSPPRATMRLRQAEHEGFGAESKETTATGVWDEAHTRFEGMQ